jgi:hypothetical protein
VGQCAQRRYAQGVSAGKAARQDRQQHKLKRNALMANASEA